MAKPNFIELSEAEISIPILYEDRSVIAIDKPAGWMLAPDSWDHTGRNLHLAIQSSINAGDFWARSRNLRYLRFIHRLDAETSGLTLFAKSVGALRAYSELFEERLVEKTYLVVVEGKPKDKEWDCTLPLMAQPGEKGKGRMQVVPTGIGLRHVKTEDIKPSETHFKVLAAQEKTTLVEASPKTGRTHQIRLHLSACGYPVVGDPLYGTAPAAASKGRQKLALRAVGLSFRDPFQKRSIFIRAPREEFLKEYGFPLPPKPAPKKVEEKPVEILSTEQKKRKHG